MIILNNNIGLQSKSATAVAPYGFKLTSAVKYSKMAALYTAAVAPTRPWLVVRCLRCRWIRPTGNCDGSWRRETKRATWTEELNGSLKRTDQPYARKYLLIWLVRSTNWYKTSFYYIALRAAYPAHLKTGPLGPGHCLGLYLGLLTRFTARLCEQNKTSHLIGLGAWLLFLGQAFGIAQRVHISPLPCFRSSKTQRKERKKQPRTKRFVTTSKGEIPFRAHYKGDHIVMETPLKPCNNIHCLILDSFSWLNSE